MATPLTRFPAVVFSLFVVWLWVGPKPSPQVRRSTVPRIPRPRTPDDCPLCRLPHPAPPQPSLHPPLVKPWSECTSRRGAPKHVSMAGYACPNPNCPYAGNSDPKVHALVGSGHHGWREPIQDFRCQACGTKFTARRQTPLHQLKTASHRVAEVLTALSEGLDTGAAVRRPSPPHPARSVNPTHSVRRGRAVRPTLRNKSNDLWLWLAIDPTTKLIPVLALGPRALDVAFQVMHAFVDCLAPGCLPLPLAPLARAGIASDGLDHYYFALTAHFGQ